MRGDEPRIVEAQAEGAEERIQLLSFSLGEEHYALRVDQVREVAKPRPIAPVPGTPAHILGVMNLRGEIVAVVDLRRLLGLPKAPPSPEARLVVAKRGPIVVGILVDALDEVVEVRPQAVEPPLSTLDEARARYLEGEVAYEDRLLAVLNVEALLQTGQRGEAGY